MIDLFRRTALAVLILLPLLSCAADSKRQAEVGRLGADVMPFSLKATTHIFTKTAEGGIQRVVAKSMTDTPQVTYVREHLHEIQAQFLKGDFSGPTHIHGSEMPGLTELKTAKPGQIAISYQDVVGGAELRFSTTNVRLVEALHTTRLMHNCLIMALTPWQVITTMIIKTYLRLDLSHTISESWRSPSQANQVERGWPCSKDRLNA